MLFSYSIHRVFHLTRILVAFRAALLQWPPLFWQFDKFAAGNAFPISGFVAFGTERVGWLGGWVVGIRYRRGPTGVRNMRAVLKRASSGTRRIFRDIRCKKQASPVQMGYSVPETPFSGTE